MADEDLEEHPSGQFSLSPGGRLRQCTEVRAKISNGARLTHSLGASPSGYIKGPRDCSGSFNLEIPKKGPERDILGAVDSANKVQARIEIPGVSVVFAIIITDVEIGAATRDSVKFACTFIGKRTATVVDT